MLDAFSPAVRAWFAASFPTPTPPQIQGWPAIVAGKHTLICAPTGSGKTLAAFLTSIDRLVTTPPPDERKHRTRVLYISPLRALAFDVEKNLRAPLAGIGLAHERLFGVGRSAPDEGNSGTGGPATFHPIEVAMRTGDTSAKDRQALARKPPDLLITTPESLYLMLTSNAAETLVGVETVIIDEIHAMAATKRGAHLAVSMERLEEITARPPQRIGLSATQRPLSEIARFLGGQHDSDGTGPGQPREVAIVDAGISKPLEVDVVIPVEDMTDLPQPQQPVDGMYSGPADLAMTPRRASIWPSIYPRILEQILAHRSTIVFCNARRQAERLAAKLNELAEEQGIGLNEEGEHAFDLVKAHHGSLAREQRVIVEDELKRGTLRAIVATSSLELGIDMGAVDLVIQVESPGAVSRGLQRIGRAGHQVGEPSKGTIYPKHRGDLLEAAVVTRRMIDGEIEHTHYLRNPLDVLAQQVVAHVSAHTELPVSAVAAMVRRTATFAELSDELLTNTLEMLAGRYPSEEFSELRPRLVWDRVNDTLRARDGSKRLAVTSGGTIPDRGLFGVFLPDGTRVGELDEEMVYESRPGETFLLGASTWRIEDITFERVTVTPAPGQPGKMPFWHGDRPGRPLELGRALGAFVRELRALPPEQAMTRLREHHALDEFAASNLLQYLGEQAEATGVVPDDRTVVVERFRDEIGDWRVCILSPFGTPVHAPWAMAIERRLADHFDIPVESMWGDDGIVLRLPEAADPTTNDLVPMDALTIDPDDIDELVVATLPQTALFSSRFRECAGRSLLLPRRRPGQRTPLWQQRQRAADLLAVAAKHPTFPVLLEASRECLQDVFDVPALREVLGQLRSRAVRVVNVETSKPSPMAQSLLFNWIAAYMYEGDAPLAERRAAALALDRDLLADLLGAEELRELLDADVLADVELDLQRLSDGRRARSADELHDVLRRVGDLTLADLGLRCEGDPGPMIDALVAERRAIEVGIAGEQRYVAAEDAARYRDALGCALPLGLPQVFTDPVPRPLEDLVARYARTHGPFLERDVAVRFGAPEPRIVGALAALEAEGRLVRGEFRPGGVRREWCDLDVLRQLRRRSLAVLRREVEPVDQEALAQFLPAWSGVSRTRKGLEALVETIGVLSGAPLVASALERDILPARVANYRPAMLDELCAAGEVVWVGSGAVGANDGRIRLCFADQLAVLAPSWDRSESADAVVGRVHDDIRAVLAAGGAMFWGQLRSGVVGPTDTELVAALWDLVWAGEVTNDSLVALRAFTSGAARKAVGGGRPMRRGRPTRLGRIGPAAGSGRWSLVAPLLQPAPTPTASAHAAALQLAERYGVVTREAVLAEGVVGGFSSVYGVFKVLEERGQVRRGYFVSGLGAAQFAVPGAVDRLRSMRRPDDLDAPPAEVVALSAADPAQPYGASLAWPESPGRPARIGAARVVMRGGVPLIWHDRRSHHLVTFAGAADDDGWVDALVGQVQDGPSRSVEIRKINGNELASAPEAAWVTAAVKSRGFSDGYRGLVLRQP